MRRMPHSSATRLRVCTSLDRWTRSNVGRAWRSVGHDPAWKHYIKLPTNVLEGVFSEVGWPICGMGASRLLAWHDVRKRRGRGDGDAQSTITGRAPFGGTDNLLRRGA